MDNDLNKKSQEGAIKTYRDLAIEAMDNNPTSLAKMVLDEKKKKEFKKMNSLKNPKNMALTIISVILAVLGSVSVVAVSIYFYSKKSTSSVYEFNEPVLSINKYDYKKIALVKNKDDIVDVVNEEIRNPLKTSYGDIKNIFFIKDENGTKSQLTTKEFLGPQYMDVRAPNQFILSLTDRFSFGVVSLDKTALYLLIETDNIEVADAGLYAWEKSMLYDIGVLFNVNRKYYSYSFKPMTLYNKDIRAIVDNEGNLIFAYSFIQPHKIVFFTDARAFKTLISNLKNYVKN